MGNIASDISVKKSQRHIWKYKKDTDIRRQISFLGSQSTAAELGL